MTDAAEQPQIYLITPSDFDLSTYPTTLARCLDATPVACVRLSLGTNEEDKVIRAADALREVTQARDARERTVLVATAEEQRLGNPIIGDVEQSEIVDTIQNYTT